MSQGGPLSNHHATFAEQILSGFGMEAQSPDEQMLSPHGVDEINGQRKSWHPSLLLPLSSYGFPNARQSKGKSRDAPNVLTAAWDPHRNSTVSGPQNHIKLHICQPRVAVLDGAFHQPQLQFADFRLPIHIVQPRLIKDDTPISRVYTDYLHGAKEMLESGTPPIEVLGQDCIVVDLYFRERQPSDNYTCSSWASEVMRMFPEYDKFVGLACCFFLCRLMRVS